MSTGENNAFIQLRHFAATIETGTTDRTECPWCGGGGSHEPAFAITRTSAAEARYKCHRASCGRAGRLAVWGFKLEQILDNSSQKGEQFTPRLYTSDTLELGNEWIAELLDLYEIYAIETIGVEWREEISSGNLVVPVRSPLGVARGVEVRRSKIQIPHVSGPKTKSYRVLDEPWLGWYRTTNTGPIILVEDSISALKVSRHFQVGCLHGSHVTLEMLLEVLGIAGVKQDIVLALDRDATGKALKFVAEWRFIAPNFRCVPLSKDMKFSSDSEILEICRA
jgi:hypothetical protein